jgi:ribosome-associated translation inhibitor RaiA
MAKLSKGEISATEIHSDAWSRFERAVDVVAKSPPQHRTKGKPKASPKKRAKALKSVLK